MTPGLGELLRELEDFGKTHDAATGDRGQKMLNITHDTGVFLALLIKATRARRVLEIGTSNGYSTLWLADAAEETGGAVTSVEIDPARTAMARATLERAGLTAELVTGDAGDALRASSDGAWDLVFLDAERPAYAGYWPELRRSLAPGGLVAVDNVLSHADEVAEFRALVESDASVATALDPIGAGVLFVVSIR